jgi:hypothetical protein
MRLSVVEHELEQLPALAANHVTKCPGKPAESLKAGMGNGGRAYFTCKIIPMHSTSVKRIA